MYWLDSTLLTLLALGGVLGFVSGLLWQVARVVGLGAALYCTVFFHEQGTQLVRDYLLRDADAMLIKASAYALVFLAIYSLLYLITQVVRRIVQASGFAWLDRCLGACLGAVKTAAILGAACLLLNRFTHPMPKEWMTRSSLAPALCQSMETALAMIPDDYKQTLADSLVHLRDKVGEPDSIPGER